MESSISTVTWNKGSGEDETVGLKHEIHTSSTVLGSLGNGALPSDAQYTVRWLALSIQQAEASPNMAVLHGLSHAVIRPCRTDVLVSPAHLRMSLLIACAINVT